MNYYHEAKILDDNKKFNLPNPLMCLTSLSVLDSKNMKKNCGDLLNIIGDPSGTTLVRSKINYDEKTKIYPYISATTVEAIANYKVKDNESGE
jgi:putative ABC transport system permease protein